MAWPIATDSSCSSPWHAATSTIAGWANATCCDASSEAERRFQVDRDRVYLSGESMGGNGTWLIASRNPQLFAAAAPVFGGWDYRINVNGYAYTNPQATRPMERFVQEAHASFAGAEGLRNVPLYVLHGDQDAAVPVEQSRHGVSLLQRWGYDVRYREIPGRGHEDLKARDEIAAWLLEHRRNAAPREVRLRSYDLAGASAHWMKVLAWQSPLEMIEARANTHRPRPGAPRHEERRGPHADTTGRIPGPGRQSAARGLERRGTRACRPAVTVRTR